MMNLAIVSPNKNAYSETFIQAHKKLHTNVFFYYGGYMPAELEGAGNLHEWYHSQLSVFQKAKMRLTGAAQRMNWVYESFKFSLQYNKIDVVFAEFGTTGAEVVPVCKELNIPLVVMFHGFDASVTQILAEYKQKYEHLFAYASTVFAVSRAMEQKLLSLGCPREKLVYNVYGPDDAFLALRPRFTEPKSFVAIGRFVNKKAPYYTLLAFKKVVEAHPDARLYFAGTGELWEACRNMVNYFGLASNVHLLGVITPEKYRSLLENVSGFLQHSIVSDHGDEEGTPVGILEASAAGMPVVSTLHAGIPDVIIHEKTGFLVAEHDVDGMAQRIIQLIEDPALARQMGAAGKENIRQHFLMDRHLRVIEENISEKSFP